VSALPGVLWRLPQSRRCRLRAARPHGRVAEPPTARPQAEPFRTLPGWLRDRDIHRFPDARHLCAWAGLTVTEHSSAEHTRRGHISKQGSRWLRWIMVEAATHALANRELGLFFTRIERKRGTKIARVALAHRLPTRVYYALRDEHGCRAFPALSPTSKTTSRGRARSLEFMAS
jgi:Transposase IS116/IS110/IS902 family